MIGEFLSLAFVNALAAVIEVLLAVVLMDSFFELRFSKKAAKYAAAIATAAILFAVSFVPMGYSLKTPLEGLMIILMLLTIYRGNLRYKAVYCAVLVLSLALSSIVSSMIISAIPENLSFVENGSLFLSMLRVLLPKLLLMIIVFCISSAVKKRNMQLQIKIRYWLLLLTVPLITLIVFTVFQFFIDSIPPQARQFSETTTITINDTEFDFPWLSIYGYILTAGIGLIFINILVFVLFFRLQKNMDMQSRYELLQQQTELQSQSIEKLENSYMRMRQLRHDMQNQLLVVRTLLDNQKYEDLEQYVKTMINTVDEAAFMPISGQSAVDAILNEKLLAAHKNKISTQFDIDDLSQLPIRPMDLCIILANALDNAVEACVKIPDNSDRYIRLKITVSDDAIVISCANPTADTPRIKNNQCPSSKKDAANHGFGLRSIQTTATKYGGDYLIRCQNQVFTLVVKLNIPQKQA